MAAKRVRRLRLGIGVVAALSVGCGACQRPPEEIAQPVLDSPVADAEDAAAEVDRRPVVPVFNDEALSARVAAQAHYLGRGSLFEDVDGRPVPAIEVGNDEDATGTGDSIDDDILDSLPGSAGHMVSEGMPVQANGNALGLFVPLENPEALAGFHNALRKLRRGDDPDGKVRIAAYGASHTQADVYTGYMRTYLQQRFGNGGHGFIHLVRTNKWYKHVDIGVKSEGWVIEHAQRLGPHERDGYYGLMGASASSESTRSFGKIYYRNEGPEHAASRYEILYLAQPGGGEFKVFVDGKHRDTVDTDAGAPHSGFHAFTTEPGLHEIEVRVTSRAEVRLFGILVENDSPGVVVDTLGISGTRATNILKWDEESWAAQIKRRQPDLFTLAYGTNESTDGDLPIRKYRDRLVRVLERFRRAVPDASCLLIGPGDSMHKIAEETFVTRPRLVQIVEVQRRVAREMGCGFWDGVAFMGGYRSVQTWKDAVPRMASRDHVHLTRRGYVRMGMAVTDALMVDFDAG